MNRRSLVRLTLHLAVVAAALGLGVGVRAMLPARSAAEAPAGKPTAKAEPPAEPPADAPPLFAPAPGRALADRSPAEYEALRVRFRNLSRSSNPLREQMLLRAELLDGISSVEDFQRALELLDSAGAEIYYRQELVTEMASRLGKIDPEMATGAMNLIKDRQLAGPAFDRIMEDWAKRDPEAALAFVGRQSLRVKANALNAVFRELAKRDPEAALARSRDFNDPGFHFGLERTVLSEWWLKDRDAALAWVAGREPEERKPMMRALLDVAGNRDPEGAWKFIQTLPASEKPDIVDMSNLLYMWTSKDAPAALGAVLTEPDAGRRGEVLEQLGRAMQLAGDGATGKERNDALLAKITDETMRQKFLYGLVLGSIYDGRERDYPQSLTLAAQLTDEKLRMDMIKAVGGSWGRTDAPSASEWLTSLAPGPERDGAIGEFVRSAFVTDPAAALTWSASIADDGKRSRRLMELYPKWLKSDATSATAWLSRQTNLSETDRSALENGAR